MPSPAENPAILAFQTEMAALPDDVRASRLTDKRLKLDAFTTKLNIDAGRDAAHVDSNMIDAARTLKIQLAFHIAGSAEATSVLNAIAGRDNFSGGDDIIRSAARARHKALNPAPAKERVLVNA